jgi:hypothetical protein
MNHFFDNQVTLLEAKIIMTDENKQFSSSCVIRSILPRFQLRT